ncbi:MAG: SH3 domain-containing protein, partial [Lachnospiraceae bacterium]|nr:SH3 domain-containing protein [Lachnospiraceae bacterium]
MKRRQAYAVICALSLFTSVISGVTVMAEPETQAVEQSETADESTEADAEQSGTAESESLEEETEGETEVFIDHPEARISIPYDQPEAWGEIAMTNDDTVETGINLRDKKDEDGTVLGFLYHGCAVWVLNKGEEWSEVYSGGMTGYVKNEYLTFGDEAKGLGEHYGVDGVTASWDGVNVYAAPDGGSEVVKVMNTGDDMVVLEDNGHWLTVKLDAKNKAYVSEDDVVRVLLVDAAMPKDGVYKDEVVEESTEEEYTETEEPQTEA